MKSQKDTQNFTEKLRNQYQKATENMSVKQLRAYKKATYQAMKKYIEGMSVKELQDSGLSLHKYLKSKKKHRDKKFSKIPKNFYP